MKRRGYAYLQIRNETTDNRIHRRMSRADSGEWLRDEFIAANEALMMYAPLLEHNEPASFERQRMGQE